MVVVAKDPLHAAKLERELLFFLHDEHHENQIPILSLPDWETLPYDTFSPHQDIISERLTTLYRLPQLKRGVLILPVSTLMHRLCPKSYLLQNTLILKKGEEAVNQWLSTSLRDYLETGSEETAVQFLNSSGAEYLTDEHWTDLVYFFGVAATKRHLDFDHFLHQLHGYSAEEIVAWKELKDEFYTKVLQPWHGLLLNDELWNDTQFWEKNKIPMKSMKPGELKEKIEKLKEETQHFYLKFCVALRKVTLKDMEDLQHFFERWTNLNGGRYWDYKNLETTFINLHNIMERTKKLQQTNLVADFKSVQEQLDKTSKKSEALSKPLGISEVKDKAHSRTAMVPEFQATVKTKMPENLLPDAQMPKAQTSETQKTNAGMQRTQVSEYHPPTKQKYNQFKNELNLLVEKLRYIERKLTTPSYIVIENFDYSLPNYDLTLKQLTNPSRETSQSYQDLRTALEEISRIPGTMHMGIRDQAKKVLIRLKDIEPTPAPDKTLGSKGTYKH